MRRLALPPLKRVVVTALCAVLLLPLHIGPSLADGRVEANQDRVVHRGYSRLAAAWWKWVLSQPAATNPLLDPTGEFCREGQRGRVWFLAGVAGDGAVTRSCRVPAGKDLFFPLVNFFSGATPDDPPELRTVAAQRALVATLQVRRSTDLSVTVDGRRRPRLVRYEDSKVFRVALPDGNLFGLPAGTVIFPAVDSGYYARVPALGRGRHVLHFTGRLPDLDGQTHEPVDVTYRLTVGGPRGS